MKLWLIEQDVNNNYDTYDSAVVAAEDEDAARDTWPSGYGDETTRQIYAAGKRYSSWAPFDKVKATYLGEARDGMPAGVLCSSFNAG